MGPGAWESAHLCRAPSWHSRPLRMPGSFVLCDSTPPTRTGPKSPCSGRPGGPPVTSPGYRRGAVSVHTVSAWNYQPAAPGLWAPGCQDAGQEAHEVLQVSGWTGTGTAVLGLKPGSQPGSPKGHLKASNDEHLLQRLEPNRIIQQLGKKISGPGILATQCGGWVYSEQIWATM